jgi:hypothetical protein
MAIIINRTLYGIDTIKPLDAVVYVYSYSSGVEPMTNSTVRILIDSSVSGCVIQLPEIASFGGIYDVTVIIQNIGDSSNVVYVSPNVEAGDYIGAYGGATNWYITNSALFQSAILTIGTEGHWIQNGLILD